MLFNFQSNKLRKHLLVGGALCAAALGFYGCKDGYNLDDDQPTGLNTIYGYMVEQGNYKNFLQLIDDLGEKETLSKTGSKTLFIADDNAFETFYRNNQWGVSKYEELTLAQKKLILRSSMIDNPYPISLMSSVQGPIEGECMRRTASLQTYDSVLVLRTDDPQLPQTSYWTNLAQDHDTIVLFKDGSGASPMIHFLPRFLEQNMITGNDVDYLYNLPVGTHKSDDAFVNNCKVLEANIFCKNGFLHKVDKVMLPLDNMAEVIRTKPQLSQFSELVERFAAPFYDFDLTRRYNEIYGLQLDSVFQKSYFAKRGSASRGTTSTERNTDKDRNAVDALLKFDPGWNRYQPGTILDNNRDEVMEDMGCMIVPTNEAIQDWWDNGGGKVLKDNYGTWDNVPNKVVAPFINNNMLLSFVASVPSKFHTILDDAARVMGITTADLDSVFLACNGAVYQTNRVFSPTSYSSVLFPALVTEAMSVIYNAIEVLQFDAYLNSMVSTYSFFIPVNDGMLTYIDPVSLGQSETHIWKFTYNPDGRSAAARIRATIYKAELQDDGSWLQTDSLQTITGSSNSDQVYDRLEDILDNIIVIGALEKNKHYYQTKGKNYVWVDGEINVEGGMVAAGGWQLEQNAPQTVTQIYNMENGKSYVVNNPLYTSHKATSDILAENPDFSLFFDLLNDCGALSTGSSRIGWSATSHNGNLIYIPVKNTESINYLLNTYHYTIYAPTNAAMEEAYALGLPTPEMVEEAEAIDDDDSTYVVRAEGDTLFYANVTDSAAHLRKVMLDFVKYHIQDNAIFVDKGFESGRYETAKVNPTTGRSYKLTITVDSANLKIEGISKSPMQPEATQVVNKSMMYNVIGREYWLNNATVNSANMIETASSVVVHAIDHPLLYKYNNAAGADLTLPENNQFIYSPFEVYSGFEDEAVKSRQAVKSRIK